MANYYTEATAKITAHVDGVDHLPKIKSWSSYEGGSGQAATTQLLPGGMQPAVALPGPIKRATVTVKRPYTAGLHPHVANLENAINNSMSASYTPTDANGNPIGNPITRTGILKEVTTPNSDATSSNPQYLALVMECDT